MIKYSDEIKSMNLWEKISQISSEIQYLQKDNSVGYGTSAYKAISIEKVMGAVSDKMNKYGIVIYPSKQSYTRTDEVVVKKDGSQGINRVSDVEVEYTVVNIHNPVEQLITVSAGTGVDSQDKGVGKSLTYSYKGMLMKIFAINSGKGQDSISFDELASLDTDNTHSEDYTRELMGEAPKNKQNKTQNTQNKTQNKTQSHDVAKDNIIPLDAPKDAPKSTFKMSDAQRKRMFAIAKKAGISDEKVGIMIVQNFNKQSTKELSRMEYDAICGEMELISAGLEAGFTEEQIIAHITKKYNKKTLISLNTEEYYSMFQGYKNMPKK